MADFLNHVTNVLWRWNVTGSSLKVHPGRVSKTCNLPIHYILLVCWLFGLEAHQLLRLFAPVYHTRTVKTH
jgi:hypothetical protein